MFDSWLFCVQVSKVFQSEGEIKIYISTIADAIIVIMKILMSALSFSERRKKRKCLLDAFKKSAKRQNARKSELERLFSHINYTRFNYLNYLESCEQHNFEDFV